jgi:hypothetical protein
MEAFVRADGAVISPIYLITSVGGLADSGLVRRIQYVQEDYERVVVRLAPDPAATDADIARWTDAGPGQVPHRHGPGLRGPRRARRRHPAHRLRQVPLHRLEGETREPALAKLSA